SLPITRWPSKQKQGEPKRGGPHEPQTETESRINNQARPRENQATETRGRQPRGGNCALALHQNLEFFWSALRWNTTDRGSHRRTPFAVATLHRPTPTRRGCLPLNCDPEP